MLYYFFVSLEAYGGDDGISLFSRNTVCRVSTWETSGNFTTCAWPRWPPFSSFLAAGSLPLRHGDPGLQGERTAHEVPGFSHLPLPAGLFVIAGAGAGLAGALIANQTEYVSPG
jgi:branched-chain amino acid transport system permease protein